MYRSPQAPYSVNMGLSGHHITTEYGPFEQSGAIVLSKPHFLFRKLVKMVAVIMSDRVHIVPSPDDTTYQLRLLRAELSITNDHLARILAALERHPLLSKFLAKVG